MTIDRAIKRERAKAEEYRAMSSEGNAEIAEINIRCSKYHEQLAEWLEKYKQVEFEANWYLDACSEDKGNKQYNMDIAFNSILKTLSNADTNTKKEFAEEIRNKAIDDFFDELQNYEDSDDWLRLKMSSIYQIAEQLKEGSADNE